MKNSFIVLFAFLLVNCKGEAQVFPDKNWAVNASPETDGWGPTARSIFTRYIIDSTNVTGLLLLHKGKIVLEYGDVAENSYIASCRKSVLAMLYGNYVERNKIDLNKTLEELGIQDVSELLPIEKQATVRDVLSARSGVYLRGANGGDFRQFAPERGSVNPGSYWLYNNWDFNLAGYIFEKETGKNIYDEIETQLAIPLQMQDWNRSLQTKSGDTTVSRFPAYHMWFSTRDMARIGLLMLQHGQWKNKQLIPRHWIDDMLTQRTSYKETQKNVPILKEDGLDLGYGYMWWLIENTKEPNLKGAYSAQGALGQNITVFPAIDAVLVFKTKNDYKRGNSIQTQMTIIKKAAEIYY